MIRLLGLLKLRQTKKELKRVLFHLIIKDDYLFNFAKRDLTRFALFS